MRLIILLPKHNRTGPTGQGYVSSQQETANQMINRVIDVKDQGTQNMLQKLKKSMDTGFKNLKEYINAM